MTEEAKTALVDGLNGRIASNEALLDLDLSTFVTDGKVNTEALTTWVNANSTPATLRRRAIDLGAGRGRGTTSRSSGVEAGRDMFNDMRGKR